MWESYNLSALLVYVAALTIIGSYVQNVFYNIYRHPLRHIPGPKIAAATYLYQTYYSLVGVSRYYIKIGKLHNKYGEPPTFHLTRSRVILIVFDPTRTSCPHHP
jgi:hypothetical protein